MEIKIVEGMKVRVREDLSVGEIYRRVGVVSEMVEVAGKTFTVEEVDDRDNSFTLVEVDWWWTPEMVETEGEENMLEVGMKVKVRKDLVGGTYVDGRYVNQDMADMGGDILTIEKYNGLHEDYNVEENEWHWKKEMFEEVDVFVKKVGQKYRVLDTSGGHHFDVGEIIILQEIHEDKCSYYSDIEGTERWFMYDIDHTRCNVELLTGSVEFYEEGVSQIEKIEELVSEDFVKEVGQLYRVLRSDPMDTFAVGEIIRLTRIDSDKRSRYDKLDGSNYMYMIDIDDEHSNIELFVKEVGQLYKILPGGGIGDMSDGDIVRLIEIEDDNMSAYETLDGSSWNYMYDSDHTKCNVELFTGSVDVDNVERPPHYTKYSTEVIDIIEEVIASYPEDMRYHIGNVIKYLLRAPHKGKLEEDLSKALWYIDRILD